MDPIQWTHLDNVSRLLPTEYECKALILHEKKLTRPENITRLINADYLTTKSIADFKNFLQKTTILKKLLPAVRILSTYFLAKHYFRMTKPDILILPQETARIEYNITKAAHKQGIPVLSLPTGTLDPLSRAIVYYNDKSRQVEGLLRKFIARFFPKWTYTYQGRKLLHTGPNYILSASLLGKTPTNPWYYNSGWITSIGVESNGIRDYAIANKTPSNKIKVIGSTASQLLFIPPLIRKCLRKEMAEEYGLNPGKPIFYCSLPLDYPDKTGDAVFKSHEECIENIVKPLLNLKHTQVLFGLHPRAKDKNYAILEKNNISVHRGNLSDYLPLVDGYITCRSTTTSWAMMLGLPVLDFDVYGGGYTTNFNNAGATHTVYTLEDYIKNVNLLDNPNELKKWQLDAQKHQEYWGKPDGMFKDRLIDLLHELVQQSKQN